LEYFNRNYGDFGDLGRNQGGEGDDDTPVLGGWSCAYYIILNSK
jgi:hypothetical protein